MNGTYIFEIVNRTIVPSATEELAVVNDNDSRCITFKIPSVIDGIDITDKILTVRYVNSLNRYDQFFCNTREVVTEGNKQFILFDWILDSNVTSAKGTVTYDVSIYDTNDIDDGAQYILHTKPATLKVDDGLLDVGSPIEDENVLQEAIDSFNAIASKYYSGTLAAAKSAQAAADAANKSAELLKIDATLTISGQAADAKVVGDKLAGKAESSVVTSIRNDLQNEIDRAVDTDSQLKEDIGEKETAITDIQKKMSDSNSNDGFLLCDLNGNIVGHIASFEVWNNEPYNKKYGWGGHPYGNGKLPPYSKIAGVFEADLLSVCGGKGRWNKDDTGNFQHGGHLFEGWNAEEDVRLTFGIGTKNKDIAWIQTFHAATQEGSDSGAYYCITKVGSDIDNQGMNFMPTITQSRSLFSLKVGNNLAPKSEHIQKLVETGELVDWEYNKNDMVPYGTMYFDYTNDKVRVYTRTGGWKYLKFEEEV